MGLPDADWGGTAAPLPGCASRRPGCSLGGRGGRGARDGSTDRCGAFGAGGAGDAGRADAAGASVSRRGGCSPPDEVTRREGRGGAGAGLAGDGGGGTCGAGADRAGSLRSSFAPSTTSDDGSEVWSGAVVRLRAAGLALSVVSVSAAFVLVDVLRAAAFFVAAFFAAAFLVAAFFGAAAFLVAALLPSDDVAAGSAVAAAGCWSRIRPSRSARRRTRSACASSMPEECVLTPMPKARQRSRHSLFVSPSSLASSWTRIFLAKAAYDQPFVVDSGDEPHISFGSLAEARRAPLGADRSTYPRAAGVAGTNGARSATRRPFVSATGRGPYARREQTHHGARQAVDTRASCRGTAKHRGLAVYDLPRWFPPDPAQTGPADLAVRGADTQHRYVGDRLRGL